MSEKAHWETIIGLVSEIKKCDELNIITAAMALAFICIDTLASLSRSLEKTQVTRSDFMNWVDKYLKTHPDQPYKYRGVDVYAARCAFLHTYGTKAQIHEKDPDILKFGYHNGGMHIYKSEIDSSLVLISTKSFINDVICAVMLFMEDCKTDNSLREQVEERLPHVLKSIPLNHTML